jgi:hypothetical protein
MGHKTVVGLCVLALGAGACGGGSESGCPPFTQIVSGDFGQTGDRLWWTLEVSALPAELTFNQADVPNHLLEYVWAIDLDSDRNGETDLRVEVFNSKQPGAAEITTDDILSVTGEHLWTVEGSTSATIGDIDVTITGNTFRFEAFVAQDPGLGLVAERDQSSWWTLYRFGPNLNDDFCLDRLN